MDQPDTIRDLRAQEEDIKKAQFEVDATCDAIRELMDAGETRSARMDAARAKALKAMDYQDTLRDGWRRSWIAAGRPLDSRWAPSQRR